MKTFLPLAAVAVLGLAACRKPAAPASIPASAAPAITNRVAIPESVRRNLGMNFAKAEAREVAGSRRYPGQLEAAPGARHRVGAPAAGRLHLLVKPLQQVEAGQELARLDAPVALEWTQRQAEAAQAKAKATTAASEAAERLQAAEAEAAAIGAAAAALEARRAQLEQARGAGAAVNAELAQIALDLAAARERAAANARTRAELRADAKRAGDDLAAAETAARGAEAALAMLGVKDGAVRITAPAAGTVEAPDVTDLAFVEAGAPLLDLTEPNHLRGRFSAPHADAAWLAGPLSGRLQISGLGDEMTKKISLAPAADQAGLVLFVDLTPAPAGARAGVPAVLQVTAGDASTARLAVPSACVVTDAGKPWLFRRNPRNPDEAIRLEADLGRSNGQYTEILSGLAEGDEVVMDGAWQLMLATSSSIPKGGHFHADGTFHEGGHEGEGGKH